MVGRGTPLPAVYSAFVGSAGSVFITPAPAGLVIDPTYTKPVSASAAPPCQLEPPPNPGATIVPLFPFWTTNDGGEKTGPIRYPSIARRASSLSAGVKSIKSFTVIP